MNENNNFERDASNIAVDNKMFAAKVGFTAIMAGISVLGLKTYGSAASITKGSVSLWDYYFNNNYIVGEKLEKAALDNPSAFSSDFIELVNNNTAQEATVAMVAIGITLPLLYKFVKSQALGSLVQVYDKGLDSQLKKAGCEPKTPAKYKDELRNTFYSHSIECFRDNVKQTAKSLPLMFSSKDIKKPYLDNPEYNETTTLNLFDSHEQNEINLLHLTALIAKSDTSLAQEIRSSNIAQVPHIREILNNSDDICEILNDNIPKLNDFLDQLVKSLGQDSEFFLTSFKENNYKKEFNQMIEDALIKTAKTHQSYSVHQDFCIIIDDLHTASKNKTLDSALLKKYLKELGAFEALRSNDSGTVAINKLVDSAKVIKETLEEERFSNNPELVKVYLSKKFLKNHNPGEISKSDTVFNNHFSSYVKKPKDNIRGQIKEEIFSAMEIRAKAFFDSKDDFDDAKYSKPSDKKSQGILTSYRLNPFGEVDSKKAAQEVMLKIQQRMVQRVITDEHESCGP